MAAFGGSVLLPKGSKVDLRISASRLLSIGGLAPDAFVVVFQRDFGKSDWMEVCRSETIKSSNPKFKQLFSVVYNFALYQEVRIVVFDRSTQSNDLRQQRLIGATDCTLGRILAARGDIELNIVNLESGTETSGSVSVSAEEVVSAKHGIVMEIGLSELVPAPTYAPQHHTSVQETSASKFVKKGAAVLNRLLKDERPIMQHQHQQPQGYPSSGAQYGQQASHYNQYPHRHQPAFVPVLVISRAPPAAITEADPYSPSIQWEEVYRSHPAENFTNLTQVIKLSEVSISEYDLCHGNEHGLIKFSVLRTQTDAQSTVVGENVTSLSALRRIAMSATSGSGTMDPLPLRPQGKLMFFSFQQKELTSFVNYVRNGQCDFSLTCAIDFTSSNGDPSIPGTCHYNPPHGASAVPNQYEAAMRAVGNILATYSSDSQISAFGFGANLPPLFATSHCFPVSEQQHTDTCDGVDGLVRAYKQTLSRVQLAGPTIFAEILRTAGTISSRRMEAAMRSRTGIIPYTVLLILTDGVISDFDAAVAELINLSYQPVSVVIIGIGSEDFRKMKQLDDGKSLRRGTVIAKRDIVQFVPYRDFQGDLSALAERVLSRLPEQVMSYMTSVHPELSHRYLN